MYVFLFVFFPFIFPNILFIWTQIFNQILQYITYDIIHMFMGEKYKQNAIFLYRKNVFTKNNYKTKCML